MPTVVSLSSDTRQANRSRGDPLFSRMAALLDQGPLAGNADVMSLRSIVPNRVSVCSWRADSGNAAVQSALGGGSLQYQTVTAKT